MSVRGATTLVGGAITSTQAAVDNKLNAVTTSSLVASDIVNHDDYSATGITVSAGTGGASGGVSKAEGHQSSVTRAGVSDAVITISCATAGDAATASLDRTVRTDTNSSAALTKAWNARQLKENAQLGASVMAEFGQNASRAIGHYAGGKSAELHKDAAAARSNGNDTAAQQLDTEASKWDEGGTYRIAAHAATGALTGNVEGAIGAAASAASVPMIASAVDAMNLSDPVRKSVIAATGAATGLMTGTAGAAAALNQTANNYLKHEEVLAKRSELAACKDDAGCKSDVTTRWDKVSQQRNDAMTTSCANGSAEQCRATMAEVTSDMAALLSDPTGTGLIRFTPEESNNLKQATEKYRTGLEVLAQSGNQALGTTSADPDTLAVAGYLTAQEALALKQLRAGQMVEFLTATAMPGVAGIKGLKPAPEAERAVIIETPSNAKTLAPHLEPEADFAGRLPVRPVDGVVAEGTGELDTPLSKHLVEATITKRQIDGGHNRENFNAALRTAGGVKLSETEGASGIFEVRYQLPSSTDKWKTVYDPAVYSDALMASMASQAAAKGIVQYGITGEVRQLVSVNGLTFFVPISSFNKQPYVPTVYPTMSNPGNIRSKGTP